MMKFDINTAREIQKALITHGSALAEIGLCGIDLLPCGVCAECMENMIIDCDVCGSDAEPVVMHDAPTDTGHELDVCRHCAVDVKIGSRVNIGRFADEVWA